MDETGSIGTGKLILSDTAWRELLGHTASELSSASSDKLSALEQRLLFLRVTLGFGWAAEETYGIEGAVGRLCVWGVRM